MSIKLPLFRSRLAEPSFLLLLLLCGVSSAQELEPSLRLSHALPPAMVERAALMSPRHSPTTEFVSGAALNTQRLQLARQLVRALEEHQLIEAFTADRDVAAAQKGAERSGYFPKLSTRLGFGLQDYTSPSMTDGKSSNTSERSVGLNQVLWDFGATLHAVNRAGKQLSIAETELESQRQSLLYQAIESVLNLARTAQTLSLGKVYEQQLASIANFENEKIIAGRGLATDLEQAASQVELSKSRNDLLLSSYQSARYRFESIFLEQPKEDFSLSVIPDVLHLPSNLAAMVSEVEAANYDLRNAESKIEMRREERSQVIARDFLPRVDLQVEASQRSNFDAVPGRVNNEKAAVVASWSFDIGNKSGYVIDSLSSSVRAEAARAGVVKKQVVEEAKTAWSALEAANQRFVHLQNQRTHAERFVEFVKIEREFGRRTLLEALNAELLLLNVQTDLVAAIADRKLAAYRILKSMGQLNFNSLRLAEIDQGANSPAH